MCKIVFIVLFLTCSVLLNGQEISYGLTFKSIDVNKDIRTGLDLTADKPLNLSEGFSLEFDLIFHSNPHSYGYVFRIIENDMLSLDLITNTRLQTLNFVLNSKENIISNIEFDKEIVKNDEWLNVKLQVNSQNIIYYINNFSKEMPYSFDRVKGLKIFFGKNGHSLFYTSDVPSMTIKNLIIKDKQGNILRNWKMFNHGSNYVLDEEKNAKAVVSNGKWVIDEYTRWKKIETISTFDKNAQIAYDYDRNRIFISTNDSLLIYSIQDRRKESLPVEAGSVFRSGGSHMVFDSKNNRLLSYSILYDDFITFDFEKRKWSSDQTDEGFPPLQQHNRLVDTVSNQLILFAGYGIHKYHAELYKHSLDGGKWEIEDLSSRITPRYLSSMGYLEQNKLLVLGGYGNAQGKQEALSRNLYDLWEIDFADYSTKKLAEFTPPQEHFVLSNSMVIDKENTVAYSLAYNNDQFNSAIQMMSFNWATSEVKLVGDSIPYNFLDIESFCDLVLDKKAARLYAIILQGQQSDKFDIEIYSINYPPMNKNDILQTENKSYLHTFFFDRKIIVVSILSILFVVAVIVILQILRNRRKSDRAIDIPPFEIKNNSVPEEKETIATPNKITSTINLLGGFQVYDKDGNDITEEFTSIIKQLFLYILLNTVNEGKKITSERINETFWLGMDKTSASNNRSVNIRKLRTILDKVGKLEILNKNSYWYTSIGDNIDCDYYKVLPLLREVKQTKNFPKKSLEAILDIASKGILLPNINADWVDDFKDEYSDIIIDIFSKAMEQPDIQEDLKLMLRITNLILLQDNIDENAVKNKCRVLYKLGQKGSSKQCYERFYGEYKKILNAEPDFTYDDIFK